MKVEPAVYRFKDNRWGWCKLGEVTEIINSYRRKQMTPELTALEVFDLYRHLARPHEGGNDLKLNLPPYLYVFSEYKTQVVLTGHFGNTSGGYFNVHDPNELLLPRGWAKDAIKAATRGEIRA